MAKRIVLVTGGMGGLGESICTGMADQGYTVVATHSPSNKSADAWIAAMRDKGYEFHAVPCDVADYDSCAAAVKRVEESVGPVDVLVNNAGITHRSAFTRTEPAVIRRVMEVNFFGALHCTHAALEDLVARRGMVIGISSVAGFAPLIARTGYAASKHALHGFFDSLRTEVEPLGVKVLLVCPSFISTGIERNALAGDGGPARHPQSIVGTRATPEAMAEKIFRAAEGERRLLLPDRVSRLSWWVSRLAPRCYESLMARKLRQEMD